MKQRKQVHFQNVHRLFTYVEISTISIITRVTRKDDGIAHHEKRKCIFWPVDVLWNGRVHDIL